MVDDFRFRDAKEREAIARDLDTTFLVEAAAGTGKTTSMVTRMVALISEGKADAHRIAAITFTRKAAAHLRQKFQNELEKANLNESDPIKKEKLAEALEQFDRCYIGTIHSFCARLLRERPVEAGIDPGFSEIEDDENARLREQCWHDYTQRLFVEESTLLADMERFGVSFDNLKATYETLSEYPDVEPAIASLPEPDFSVIRSRLIEFLKTAEQNIPSEVPDKGWDALQQIFKRSIGLARVLDLNEASDLMKILEIMDASPKVTQARWASKTVALDMQEEFNFFKENLVLPSIQQWREYLHPILINAVIPAVADFQHYRRDNGMLNFSDLLMMARDLVRNHPHIRRYFRERYTHLLIDEFQDTDPIQAELMLYLTGEDANEMDWRKMRPVPGSLFVVGDPKQSIYRFRRADITTYNSVSEIVEKTGGEVLRLVSNFRSAESICEHINRVFDGLFPPASSEEQAANVRLHPRKANLGDICGVYRLDYGTTEIKNSLGVNRVNTKEVVQVDSEKIAGWIRAALDRGLEMTDGDRRRPVTPGDFLIILKNKKYMAKYAQALESLGIPFEITGGGGFAESDELAALLPLLKSIIDPDDSLSLLAYLRGPLCGVSDSAIYSFKRAGGIFSFNAKVPECTDPAIVTAFGLLREAREWSRKLPPAAALVRICESLGTIAQAAAMDFGNTRAGNLLKTLVFARKLSLEGNPFAAIVSQIEEMIKGDIEGMGIEPGRADAVRIMNLHKSKGLEAPIVFLACPTDGKDHAPKYYVDRSVDPPTGHFAISVKNGFADREIGLPVQWESLASIERRFADAEEDRLLYVAGTRPMNALVVSVYQSESGNNQGPRGPWVKLAAGVTERLPKINPLKDSESEPAIADMPSDFADVQAQIKTRTAAAVVPGYAVTHVTKLAHAGGTKVIGSGGRGHGAAWGSVLHGCLESLMRDSSLDIHLLASNLMRQHEMTLDELDLIVRHIELVLASDLWRRASSEERCLVEVPFALQVTSTEIGMSDGPAQTVLNGVIDLVFREPGGWVIVDYKSDVTDGRLSDLVAAYSPQVNCYKKYWCEITGEPVTAALYFVDGGHVEWL